MTDQDLFKLGFLQGCAADGLTLAEMEKCAEDLLQQAEQRVKTAGVSDWLSAGNSLLGLPAAIGSSLTSSKDLLTGGLKTFFGIPMLAGAAVGGATGAALGHMRGLSDEDVEEEKLRELTDAYRRAAQKMRQRANAPPD